MENEVDVQEIVLSHIRDAYSWHIGSIDGKEIEIHLPVIVRSHTGEWHAFSSCRIAHGQEYLGFRLAESGNYEGKLIEEVTSGNEVRPIDLSITKNVSGLLLCSILLVWLVLRTARWYRKHPLEAPRGLTGIMEICIEAIREGVIKANIGEDHKRYTTFLLTAFFFILFNNLLGLIPIFPGGSNVTGNISVALTLALFTFIIVIVSGTRAYWKEIFWPHTPLFLKLPLPLMPIVEVFGLLTKPVALTIRLFANIMAGHTIILGLTCLIFITTSMGVAINTGMTIVSVVFCVFMNCIELLVAFIQAYIFTLLSSIYIGQARIKE